MILAQAEIFEVCVPLAAFGFWILANLVKKANDAKGPQPRPRPSLPMEQSAQMEALRRALGVEPAAPVSYDEWAGRRPAKPRPSARPVDVDDESYVKPMPARVESPTFSRVASVAASTKAGVAGIEERLNAMHLTPAQRAMVLSEILGPTLRHRTRISQPKR